MRLGERGPLSFPVWLATPVLFAAAVLGLTGLGAILLDADWHVALSTAQFGPAAAITALLAGTVEWKSTRHRWWIGLGYPAVIFVAGVPLAAITLPSPIALLIGTPAVVILTILIARERNKAIPIA